ncbi:MAG: hypothetical protein NVS2B12_06290 [Ktedonobacteraceae bacterium]
MDTAGTVAAGTVVDKVVGIQVQAAVGMDLLVYILLPVEHPGLIDCHNRYKSAYRLHYENRIAYIAELQVETLVHACCGHNWYKKRWPPKPA